MRAILTTFGTVGDVRPMLALGAELGSRGHDVILALSPNFRTEVENLGIAFAPIGPELPPNRVRQVIAAQIKSQTIADQVQLFLDAVLPSVPAAYQDLLSICRTADVIISSPYQLAGRMVHETLGVPFVSVHLSQFAEFGGNGMREISAALVNPLRETHGLPPLADPLGIDGCSPQLAIYAVSRHLSPRPPRWPKHFRVVGFFFSKEVHQESDVVLREFIESGDPPVLITFGSVMHPNPESVTKIVVDAVRDGGFRAIVQRGWSGLAKQTDLPANMRVCGFVSHAWLLPQTSLIVHHGGAGTTASAFRAGTPMVIVPHTLDQPIWAELARAVGCAKNVIPFNYLNSERLSAAIRTTMRSDHLRHAASHFARLVAAEDGVGAASILIEQLVRNGALQQHVCPETKEQHRQE